MGWQDTLTTVYRDERFILTTIGLVSFAIVTTMISTLTIIRDDNEVPPAQPKTQYITQDTENALQPGTLDKLLEHPNYSIREIATKILYDRAINDPETTSFLLRGATRPDHDERIKSLRALTVLVQPTGGFDGLSKLDDPKAYAALVKSLEIGLGDSELVDVQHPTWDEFRLRDTAEKTCLELLSDLALKFNAKGIIKAKFVEKWLSKQAWGEEPEERRRNFHNYMEHRSNRVVHIVSKMKQYRRGLRALERAGLIDKEYTRIGGDVLMDLTFETGIVDSNGQPLEPLVLRNREHSAEEQRLRRQHREAMVLNDGTRPLGREDIIERDHDIARDE